MQLSHHNIQNNNLTFNFIQDGLLAGLVTDTKGKKAPSIKSVTHILQWWNLAQFYIT